LERILGIPLRATVFYAVCGWKKRIPPSFELASGRIWRVKVDEMLKIRTATARSTPAVDGKYLGSSRGHLMAVEKKTEAAVGSLLQTGFGAKGLTTDSLVAFEGKPAVTQTEEAVAKPWLLTNAADKSCGPRAMENGYCSPTSFVFDGERQFFSYPEKAVALSAASKTLWEKRRLALAPLPCRCSLRRTRFSFWAAEQMLDRADRCTQQTFAEKSRRNGLL
jgi:hypothetical protein